MKHVLIKIVDQEDILVRWLSFLFAHNSTQLLYSSLEKPWSFSLPWLLIATYIAQSRSEESSNRPMAWRCRPKPGPAG